MKTRRPFLSITLAFIAGISLEQALRFPTDVVLLAFPAATAAAFLSFRRRRVSAVFFLFAVAMLGAFSLHQSRMPAHDHVSLFARQYYKKPVAVKGVIASDIRTRAMGRGTKVSFVLDVREVCVDLRCAARSGLVMVDMYQPLEVRYGDEVVLNGKLHRPFDFGSRGRLSYRSYLAQKKIFLMLTVGKGKKTAVLVHDRGNAWRAAAFFCRQRINAVFERHLSPAEAGIMKALITGQRTEIPPHVREIFFRTGTVHFLAISGLNIGMVAVGVFLALNLLPIPRSARMLLNILVICAYAFMTGANPPVVRATVMSVIFLLGFLCEREQDTINSLAFAAFGILIVSPDTLFDVGFQLSFSSVLSILLWTPPLMAFADRVTFLREKRILRFVLESFIVSFAAIMGVEGLLAYYFQVMTPVALLANIPVVPIVGLVTALGGGLLFFAAAFPPLAGFFVMCLKVFLNLMAGILYGFSLIPGGCFFLPEITSGQVIIYYSVVSVMYLGLRVVFRRQARVWAGWQMGL